MAITSVTIELALALGVYQFFQPDWAEMRTLSVGWIFQIWVRNFILLCLVAGGLHLWFITFIGQQKKLKFDKRDQIDKNGHFTFRNQVWDNMFWSIASSLTLWSAYEVCYFWAAANAYLPQTSFSENPIWFIAWLIIIPIWSSFHFYWAHRFLHWPPMYRLAHSLHHRNINIGPWAGISMHPIEALLYFSTLMIHFVVPSHPIHFIFHAYVNGLNPCVSHSGYEGISVENRKRFNTGDFFHQLHHRYFECNYGTAEMPWDVLFGSFHDGSDEATATTRNRKKHMHSK
ncbi:sterol desaturase family protein [Cochlodiniinecator piscidefendens]|uniref:sterol desaturase family protein n=1 Tax=Cochlodiniinecator piscidefendens TaxID=2715756 RepID=UPI001E3C1A81|nr:sterol desaturase family protein [Cochlodiniinecator piscidefendens]